MNSHIFLEFCEFTHFYCLGYWSIKSRGHALKSIFSLVKDINVIVLHNFHLSGGFCVDLLPQISHTCTLPLFRYPRTICLRSCWNSSSFGRNHLVLPEGSSVSSVPTSVYTSSSYFRWSQLPNFDGRDETQRKPGTELLLWSKHRRNQRCFANSMVKIYYWAYIF